MAERRMFAKTIIDSDAFLDMPLSSQALYFHLSMRADDEGFVNNPKKIQRVIGASEDDLKVLIAKSFIIPFESGIVVIKHWKIHNYIQSDRYKPSVYTEERSLLTVKGNNAYTLDTECIQDVSNVYPECIQDVSKVETQDSIGKDSIDKHSKGEGSTENRKRFVPPTQEEAQAYCEENHYNVDLSIWFAHYESNGWLVGKNKMKDWKASIRYWARDNTSYQPTHQPQPTYQPQPSYQQKNPYMQRSDTDLDALERATIWEGIE